MAAQKGIVGAGYGGERVIIETAPPAYVIRQHAGTSLPMGARSVVEALGGTALGATVASVLTAMMPPSRKLLGPGIAGGLGTVTALASPIGTWGQEIGQGAMTSSGFLLFLHFTGQMPGQS